MSLGKYMKRMSSVFKKEKTAEKGSKSPAVAPSTPAAVPAAEGATKELGVEEEGTKEQAGPTK